MIAPGTADVAHHARAAAGDLASADGALQRLDARLIDHVLRHAHLYADRDISVLGDSLGALLGVREAKVIELWLREAGKANVGDVHERVEARARLRLHIAAKRREVVGAGI